MWMDDCDPEDTPWNDNNTLTESYLELKERGLTAPIKVNLNFLGYIWILCLWIPAKISKGESNGKKQVLELVWKRPDA